MGTIARLLGEAFDLGRIIDRRASLRVKKVLLVVQVPYALFVLAGLGWFLQTSSASRSFSWLVVAQACLCFIGAGLYLNVFGRYGRQWADEWLRQRARRV